MGGASRGSSVALDGGARVESVFITEQLERRPPKEVDYRREMAALQELVARLADEPQAVLPRFVELAMELTGASSAGLSLYEPGADDGLFRWHHLHGALARFEGSTAPRIDSPCGVTLERECPVLAAHPERAYGWVAAAGIVIPEVLLVPLYVGREKPLGTLWVVADEAGHFRADDARLATELAGFVGTALRLIDAQAELRSSLNEQELLAREMTHRAKNVFALAESMVRLTAADASTPAEMAEALSGRLHALADAQALTRRTSANLHSSRPTELHKLAQAILAPARRSADDGAPRLAIQGSPIECGPQAANGLSLLLHELATNAVKYGALGESGGRVDLSWHTTDDTLVLEWRESGGPQIEHEPEKLGFGSSLVQRMIERQFAGRLEQLWRPEGLLCVAELSRERVRL